MKALQLATRLFLSIAGGVFAVVMFTVVWTFLEDHQMAIFSICTMGVWSGINVWDALGELFPHLFGDGDEDEEDEQ